MAGLTAAGLTIKNLQEILAEVQTSERDNIDPSIDTASTRPLGQFNGLFSEREALLWELLRLLAGQFDPDVAEGWLLDALCALTGTTRRPATRSLVTCTVNLDPTVVLPIGSTAHVEGQPSKIFRTRDLVGDAGSVASADYSVVFESEETGPVAANSGTLKVIAGPVTGWNSVINPLDAEAGIVRDTDTTLRARRAEALQLVGGATPDAIRADLLNVSGVEKVHVFENLSETTDADGVPPFSIEVLVYDGIVPAVDNDVLAQAIWDSRAGGARTHGSEFGTATDSEGEEHTIWFSRPTIRNVWIVAVVDQEGVAPVDAVSLLTTHLATEGNALFSSGVDVVALAMRCILMDAKEDLGFSWVHDVPTLALGFAAAPAGTANLPITAREIARLDTSRITITLA